MKQVLAVFTRTPELGKVKTRLQPHLSAQQALECHLLLLRNTLKQIQSDQYQIEIWVTPQTEHPILKQLATDFSLSLHQQVGTDLGQRMHHCLNNHTQSGEHIVLIGSDCPDMDANYVQKAFAALQDHDVVLGPAKDGGYVLIGARQINTDVFKNIEWGSGRVYSQTVQKLSQAGLSFKSLTALDDIDNYYDVVKYRNLFDDILRR